MSSGAFWRGQEHPLLMPPPAGAPLDVLFVDRDGTLNRLAPGYRTPADVEFDDDAVAAVARVARDHRIPVVLVTNQQGLATGRLSWPDLERVHELLDDALHAAGGRLDDVRLCPHAAGTCTCRKPAPGLFTACLSQNPWIDPGRCLMIGDADSDRDAAESAGVPFARVGGRDAVEDVLAWVLDSPQKE